LPWRYTHLRAVNGRVPGCSHEVGSFLTLMITNNHTGHLLRLSSLKIHRLKCFYNGVFLGRSGDGLMLVEPALWTVLSCGDFKESSKREGRNYA